MSSHILSPPSTPDSIGFEQDCASIFESMADQRLNSCKTAVAQLEAVLRSHPHAWRNYLQSARSVITAINSIPSVETNDWTWIVTVLQDLGFADADSGGVSDVTNWCQSKWLAILESQPNNTAAQRGWSPLALLHTISVLTSHGRVGPVLVVSRSAIFSQDSRRRVVGKQWFGGTPSHSKLRRSARSAVSCVGLLCTGGASSLRGRQHDGRFARKGSFCR